MGKLQPADVHGATFIHRDQDRRAWGVALGVWGHIYSLPGNPLALFPRIASARVLSLRALEYFLVGLGASGSSECGIGR